MSNTLNQSAPPATASKSGEDFIRLEPFPKSGSHVLTVTAYNYNPACEFKRTDDKGAESIEVRPGLEFYFGTVIGGKPYFVKPWPVPYSLHEKANYAKWYEAATGKVAAPGTKADDMIGKHVLGAVKVENKTSKKGTAYSVTKLMTVSPVPDILAATGTDIKVLLPALQAALDNQGKKEDNAPPY